MLACIDYAATFSPFVEKDLFAGSAISEFECFPCQISDFDFMLCSLKDCNFVNIQKLFPYLASMSKCAKI